MPCCVSCSVPSGVSWFLEPGLPDAACRALLLYATQHVSWCNQAWIGLVVVVGCDTGLTSSSAATEPSHVGTQPEWEGGCVKQTPPWKADYECPGDKDERRMNTSRKLYNCQPVTQSVWHWPCIRMTTCSLDSKVSWFLEAGLGLVYAFFGVKEEV